MQFRSYHKTLGRFFFCFSDDLLSGFQKVSLLQFENWLDRKLRQFYNPIANIISNREGDKRTMNKNPNFLTNNQINFNDRDDMKCRFCTETHRLNKYELFQSGTLEEKKNYY